MHIGEPYADTKISDKAQYQGTDVFVGPESRVIGVKVQVEMQVFYDIVKSNLKSFNF